MAEHHGSEQDRVATAPPGGAGSATDALRQLEREQTRTEIIVARMARAIRRRRAYIDSDQALRHLSVTIKFSPSTGRMRVLLVDLNSEEDIPPA